VKPTPYPRYKSSGVEWLGNVPEHWGVNRLKQSIERCQNGIWGDEPDGGEDDIICVRVADFDRTQFRVVQNPPTIRAIPKADRSSRALVRNDLLIEKSGGGEKQLVGCVVSFEHDFAAVCSNFVARMRVTAELSPRYWTYAHASLYAGRVNYPSIKQTTGIQNLDTSAYFNERFVYPPSEEQRAIADFLDRETARLDTLLGKKRELIEKLEEKRTALISRTVTRGLPPAAARAAGIDPHPKLKPSGIEWLGEIPKHWKAVPLRWFARCSSGDGIQTEDVQPCISESASIPVIGGNGIMGYCDKANVNHLVLAIGRVGALCGNVHFVRPPAWITDNALRLESESSAYDYRYLAAVLRIRNLNEIAAKTAQPLITGWQVRDQRLPQPSLPEQQAIVDYLDRETAKLDRMTEKVEAAIEKLQEYRTALITAAVTGKIDVRQGVKSAVSTSGKVASTLTG